MSVSEAAKKLKDSNAFRGKILLPDEPEFTEINSKVFNHINDHRKPAIIFRPQIAVDVTKAVKFANEHNLKVVARGGGHSGAARSTSDGGVLVDLSLMKGIVVDSKKKSVYVETGCVLADLDTELGYYNLALPLGTIPPTGVAGLALHGGLGLLSKKHGVSSDHIIEARVVTADGRILTANSEENEDLFWGLRGAGSYFVIVTSIVFQLHDVQPSIVGGLTVQTTENNVEFLKHWARLERDNDEFNAYVFLARPSFGPPTGVRATMALHLGDVQQAAKNVKPLLESDNIMVGEWEPKSYSQIQNSTAPLANSPPSRQYWKTLYFKEFTEELIKTIDQFWKEIALDPIVGPFTLIAIEYWGGQVAKVPKDAAPFGIRSSQFVVMLDCCWQGEENDKYGYQVKDNFIAKFAPFSFLPEGEYFNYTSDEIDSVSAHGNDNTKRLIQLKKKWDPTQVFASDLLGKRF